jgi:hypothetical protein
MTTTASADARGAETLTTGLGYYSLALGTALLGAPGAVNRLIGVRDDARSRFWQRVVAAQELTAAAGIFAQARPVPTLWGRTAGDVLHLAMLARALRNGATSPGRVAGAIAAVAGTLAADAYASARMTSTPEAIRKGASVRGTAAITVTGTPEEVQRRWREFASGGDAARLGPIEVVEEHPGRSIAFRTTGPATSGVAAFTAAPGGRGTEIHLELEYGVPGGAVGAAVAKVAGADPLQMVRDDLRRLKQLVEIGEVVRSDGTPVGPSATTQPKQRPAQPVNA